MASIYILGDSHTQALGPRLKTRLSGHSVQFESFPGQPTKIAHQKASIPSGRDVVVLSLGGNDRGDQSVARAALIAALKLRNPKAQIIWFGPFDASEHAWAGKDHDEQAESQRRQLPSLGVQWVDTRPFSKTDHQADKVHYTGTGYSKIADKMYSLVQGLLSAVRSSVSSASSEGGGSGGLLLLAAAAAGAWWLMRRRA